MLFLSIFDFLARPVVDLVVLTQMIVIQRKCLL